MMRPIEDWIHCILDPSRFLGIPASATHSFQLFAALMLDHLWMTRNKMLHDHIQDSPLFLLRQISHSYQEHLATWHPSPPLLTKAAISSFPTDGYLRMTFDVAVRSSFSVSAATLVHSNGDYLNGWTQRSNCTDPLIGEAKAAFFALSKASDLKLSPLLFQGDSTTVMERILQAYLDGSSGNSVFSWKIASIILSLKPLFSSIPLFSPSKISRADISEAHSLVAWAAAHSFTGEVPVPFLLNRGLWKFNGVKPP
ncbi:hypothetical protein CJ030_MR3G001127 [Morella rubra]|uniref:RNase H type-1 domain-containing protein n=1 Tax=Morella rubra TaxID=262757 RepID=A0A6A1W9C2_9ROSI|nr:hypothetical protein CJ030_MR3G001127 [Morella rubra]